MKQNNEKMNLIKLLKEAYEAEACAVMFYKAALERATDDKEKLIFKRLLHNEKLHEELLKDEYERLNPSIKAILESQNTGECPFFKNREYDLASVVKAAITDEEKNIQLFEKARNETDNEHLKRIFNLLYNDEKDHLQILIEELRFLK